MIRITDTIGTSGTVTVEDAYQVADAIRGWYEGAPEEVLQAVEDLERLLCGADLSYRDEAGFLHSWDPAEYLGVTVERV